ncbi:MAG: hypothetical protein K1X50_04390 [Candidatus Promineofilum sp.]|nr:hypothetical protein [Promineifilum sp.]MCW5863138.1 hypothetical protein [Anaerolineae bacterium]
MMRVTGPHLLTPSGAATNARLSRLAWAVTAAGLALLAGAVVLILLRAARAPRPGDAAWYNDLIITASLAVAIIVGGFVAARLPRNPYGWLLLAFGIGNGGIQSFAVDYILVSHQIAPLPLTSWAFYFAAFGFSLWLAAIPLLFLLFPSGRLPSRRWRWLAAGVVLSFLTLAALMWLSPSAILVSVPSPFHHDNALGRWADNLTSTAVFFILLAILISAISVIVRAIRARGLERQQFKWLGLASVVMVLAFFFNTELVPLLPGVLDALLEAAAFAGVPLAVGIAVLRYRLWDIDIIIRKTVLYGVLSTLLAAVFYVLVVALQGVFGRVTGRDSPAAVILSTLAIAALFAPMRRAVQNVIDRRFYRRKVDAEKVLADFAATARDETDLDRLTAELVRVIQEAMQPEHVSVWLREPDDGRWAMDAAAGDETRAA